VLAVLHRKRHSRPIHISDLKWKDDSGKEKTAETDSEKVSALQEFFSSVCRVAQKSGVILYHCKYSEKSTMTELRRNVANIFSLTYSL